LQVNYQGSTGYGSAYEQAGFKAWGTTIQDDIYDGVRWLVEKDIVDSNRVGIFGFSFGGYSAIQSLIRYPDKYACGVSYCGLSNLFTYIKQIPPQYKPYLEMTYEMVGHPVKDAEMLKEASPSFNWTKICKPLMIAQGRKDPRVDVNEMEWFYKNLQKNGQNVEYFVEENEGHGFRSESARTRFYHTLDSFLAKHLQPND
jgi:dipeptidyl aminopeptidase/acylaminoacyl peptidase